MFFADPVAAFANLARATVPGGRLAVVVWQPFAQRMGVGAARRRSRSVGSSRRSPKTSRVCSAWPTPTASVRILGDAGWSDVQLDDVHVPYDYGAEPAIAASPRE